MFDWLKNIFSPKPEQSDDNLVEKQSDDTLRERHRQEDVNRDDTTKDDNES
ncbi:hypothetical protein [Photobacterium atrarenae]|uniref:Uncharacterized protein n=1 Tax=Photobacterium atrarenae TaxID=865757 RepID=A0ABY5GMI5_9GAMM|nr:hypothetical protein [Photobacterium atrarenae]UTV29995.1 hypothetical protein NNL38_23655 [Photobacterium atrarenae]